MKQGIILGIVLSLLLGTLLSASQAQTAESDGIARHLYVPILMYHYVGELPANSDRYRVNLTISPERFNDHMAYLAQEGYSTISIADLDTALRFGASLPEKPIVLTFDDGYTDHYSHVFPILQTYGFTGTFFIVTQFADDNRNGYMNWGQIVELSSAGMSIEPHSKTHADLRNRNLEFLTYEIVGSIESIAHYTGREPRVFSYPGGFYDENTLRVIASTNLLRAVTTRHGAWHGTYNRFELSRLRISNNTGIPELIYLLESSRNNR